jgi:diguanylate cyclase (GGDEF)-like protein
MLKVSRLISFRGLICVATALIGLAVLAVGVTISSLRSDATEDALRDCELIATILADQTARSVEAVHAALTDVEEQVAALGIEKPEDFPRLVQGDDIRRFLLERLSRVPQADVISLTGPDGRLANSTREWRRREVSFADREYFQHLRAVNDPEMFLNLPVTNRFAGTWTLYFNKRINTRNGEFAGVISVGVAIEHFRRIQQSIPLLHGQSFLLLRRDGTMLLRYPEAAERIGRKIPPESPWHAAVAQGGGRFRTVSPFDGEPRLIAVRPVRGYPLAISVGMNESAALAVWRQRTTPIFLGTMLAVFCSVFLLRTLIRQFRELGTSRASLAAKSRELQGANRRLDAALNNMSQGLCMFDASERLVVCNDRYLEMYGLSPQDIRPGVTLREILERRKALGCFPPDPDQYIADLRHRLADRKSTQAITSLDDGRVIFVRSEPAAEGAWVATHEDITERQRAEERVAHMARHDPLTDLANRALFQERLDAALRRLQQTGQGFAVFIFDLDLFKAVNDSLGHPIGDALLKAVAQRLQQSVSPDYTVGRLGGDEFSILQIEPGDLRENAIKLANRLLVVLAAPYDIEGHQIVIGISIGIALAPQDGVEPGQLLKNADLALYRTKTEGRNGYRFYEPDMDAQARLRRSLEIDLRNALARNELALQYQTIFDISSKRICCVEALVRWHHPTHGSVPPDRFIPLAEEIGLIIPIGEWVLRKACADAVHWPDGVHLAVNLSAVQFRSGNLVEIITDALVDSGLPPSRLELEITESVLLQKCAGNIAVLHQLRNLGIGIVLDDFGTGYSSLSYLSIFPFDEIKIDKSFVAELSNRADCAAIICAVTGLGRSLQVATTAEGVETEEQLQLLRAAGCTQAQGFLLSRPKPVAELDFSPGIAQAGEAGTAAEIAEMV